MSKFRELEVIVLRKDLPTYHLRAGDLGTIVHVYPEGNFYEVEFLRSDGTTVALLTLSEEDLRRPESTEIFHVRSLTPAKTT